VISEHLFFFGKTNIRRKKKINKNKSKYFLKNKEKISKPDRYDYYLHTGKHPIHTTETAHAFRSNK
jgi:hypothetical protein